jgi:hypothetical protein
MSRLFHARKNMQARLADLAPPGHKPEDSDAGGASE